MTTKGGNFFNVGLGSLKAQKMWNVLQQQLYYWVWLKKDLYWKAGDVIAGEAHK
jgi:hypothetical protein